MAVQPNPKITVVIDISAARRSIKTIRRASEEANRELARLEDRLESLQSDLAKLGIAVEVFTK